MTAIVHEVECNPSRILIGYVFIEIVTELETARIYKVVMLII
jgi:hypothetical protein